MDEKSNIRVFVFTHHNPEAYEILKVILAAKINLVGVSFERESGRESYSVKRKIKHLVTRGKISSPSSLLKKNGINFSFFNNLNNSKSVENISQSNPDILILYGTRIIKDKILDIPNIGVLNSHSSLLPKYRGGKSEYWILKNRDVKYAGVTIHWVTPGLDEGDIFLQESLEVEKGETPSTLRKKSVPLTAKLFVKTIQMIEKGKIIRVPQDSANSSTFKRPSNEEWNYLENKGYE